MAPVRRLENEVTENLQRAGVAVGAGLVTLLVAKKVLRPIEEIVQRVVLAALAAGVLYEAVAYGPKILKLYELLNQ